MESNFSSNIENWTMAYLHYLSLSFSVLMSWLFIYEFSNWGTIIDYIPQFEDTKNIFYVVENK